MKYINGNISVNGNFEKHTLHSTDFKLKFFEVTKFKTKKILKR